MTKNRLVKCPEEIRMVALERMKSCPNITSPDEGIGSISERSIQVEVADGGRESLCWTRSTKGFSAAVEMVAG